MAQRRMFSQRITNSARFLKMSPSAQNLYFHLGMKADDDGVVEAFPIMQMLGSAEDDFKVLVVKGFLKPLNEDLVSFIMDWNEHNLIRPDRKVDSIYKNLLIQIVPEAKLLEARPRADTSKKTAENKDISIGRPLDVQWTAQVRLGKVSLGKEYISKKVVVDRKRPVDDLTLSVDQSPVWVFQEELEKLRDDKRKHLRVVALYWKKKGWVFENKEQFDKTSLTGYSGEQIARAIKHCETNYKEWSLETIGKRIADVVNKKA